MRVPNLIFALAFASGALAQSPQPPFEAVVTRAGGTKDVAESAICVKPARLADAPCPWSVRVREDEPGAIRARPLRTQVSTDGGTLYVVLRKRAGADMSDELWRHRAGQSPRRLARGDLLDFAISADGRLIAFKDQDGIMRFVDADGRDMGEVNLAAIDAQAARITQRDGDLAAFVVTRGLGTPERLLVVDVPRRQVAGYPLQGLYVGGESALDLRGRRLAFSDYPRGLDAEGAKQVRAEERVFRLQVVDLETSRTLFTAERVGEPFQPAWVDGRLTFADREGSKRVEKTFDGGRP